MKRTRELLDSKSEGNVKRQASDPSAPPTEQTNSDNRTGMDKGSWTLDVSSRFPLVVDGKEARHQLSHPLTNIRLVPMN